MFAISLKSLTPLRSCCKTSSEKTRVLAAWCMASQAFRSAPRSSWKSFSRWRSKRGSVMQGPKDAPAKALVWKQSRKPDRDGHKHYQAKTAAGCYSVVAEYQPGKGFIGYRVTQSVADKRRVIASSITADEGKALAQCDYEQGDADERTRQALQTITIRVPLR